MHLTTTNIDGVTHPLYATFLQLYKASFPIFEQRTVTQQISALENSAYRLTAFNDDGRFVGFVAWWEFDSYLYVEHFAVDESLRGKGYGNAVLRELIDKVNKTVVLEIDPVVDRVSEARLRFYTKCGFVSNPYPHTHPAYRVEYEAHSLVVLSSGRELSAAQYDEFNDDLRNVVMKD